MRRLWFLITVRRLMLLIVLVAVGFVGWRVYREGPGAHWLVLKLRYGNVETRRAAAHKISQGLGSGWLSEILGDDPGPKDPRERQEYLARSQERADLLFFALLHASSDRDPECRATALTTAGLLAVFRPNDVHKRQILKKALGALHDPEPKVRSACLGVLVDVAEPPIALEEIRAALLDSSIEVQETAVRMLGMLGVISRETQSEVIAGQTQNEVAPILFGILASKKDIRLRVVAAWAMSYFGKDHYYQTATCPDVIPALLLALGDPEVKVRQAVATIFSGTTFDARGQSVSAWNLRKDAIIPACRKALTDANEEVRDHAAVALFWLGVRDPEITALLEEDDRSPDSVRGRRFQDAVAAWRIESEPTVPADPTLGEREETAPQQKPKGPQLGKEIERSRRYSKDRRSREMGESR